MVKEFWTVAEIVERFEIDRSFLDHLEAEDIICPVCPKNASEKTLSSADMEKLRLAKILYEEMDVNLPGIEVILQMRQNMLNMRKQFDAILEDLARRLQDKFNESL